MKIIGIGIILALMLMLSGCITSPEEPAFCTEQYAPVCGFVVEGDYDTAKTYSNACFAGLDKNVTYVEVGECKKCSDENKFCTKEYVPVCGKDGKTYGNKCTAEAACVEINYYGECENTQIANPASVYCIEQNGTLEIRESENGQYGVCVFETFECEEWSFFNGECPIGKKNYCTEEQKKAEVCTMEYAPVCGYNSNNETIETYSNSCVACGSANVEYWVNGECQV